MKLKNIERPDAHRGSIAWRLSPAVWVLLPLLAVAFLTSDTTAQWVYGSAGSPTVDGVDVPSSAFLAEPAEPRAEDVARLRELLDRRDAVLQSAPLVDLVVEIPPLPGDDREPPGIDSLDPNPDRAVHQDVSGEVQ